MFMRILLLPREILRCHIRSCGVTQQRGVQPPQEGGASSVRTLAPCILFSALPSALGWRARGAARRPRWPRVAPCPAPRRAIARQSSAAAAARRARQGPRAAGCARQDPPLQHALPSMAVAGVRLVAAAASRLRPPAPFPASFRGVWRTRATGRPPLRGLVRSPRGLVLSPPCLAEARSASSPVSGTTFPPCLLYPFSLHLLPSLALGYTFLLFSSLPPLSRLPPCVHVSLSTRHWAGRPPLARAMHGYLAKVRGQPVGRLAR